MSDEVLSLIPLMFRTKSGIKPGATIREMRDGRVSYRKPKGYRPQKKYRNSWYLANLDDVCKQVWEIGQAYYQRFREKKTWPKRKNKAPVQLVKYFYFLYLTGGRLCEPLLQPPQLELHNDKAGSYISITKINEKHKDPQGNREKLNIILPIFDEWEERMWDFITDGGLLTNGKEIFKYGLFGAKEDKRTNEWMVSHDKIGQLVRRNFKADLKDANGNRKPHHSISPHILRHLRAYNLHIEHNVPKTLVAKWLGWRDERMFFWYVEIARAMSIKSQLDVIKANNLLVPGLKVDRGLILMK